MSALAGFMICVGGWLGRSNKSMVQTTGGAGTRARHHLGKLAEDLKPAVKATESNNDSNKPGKVQEGSETYKSVKYTRSSRPNTSKIELYECDDF